MDSSYPWGESFQLRLLALQLREPKKAFDLVEPSFFINPMMVDISRVVRDVYKNHPNDSISISRATLNELVRTTLGRKGREYLSSYRRMIRRVYKTELKDKEVLFSHATEFARENRFRNALVKAERAISARKYGEIPEIFEKVRSFEALDGPGKKPTRPKLSKRALYGLAGDIVRAIGPETESDPAAILLQLIVAFGNCIGPRPYFQIEATKHRANLFCMIVGRSSRSRKGTALGHVRRAFSQVDQRWCEKQITTGLSSGEGLIWAARDPVKSKHDSEKEKDDDCVESVDKRVMVVEPEFSRVLRAQRREGNVLSSVLRSGWDGETLTILTKTAPAKATGAHVSIIGHITEGELRTELRATDEANGYANRFLFGCAERSKILPFGGNVNVATLAELVHRLARARRFARGVDQMQFSKKARRLWKKLYIQLTKETCGMLGVITSRAEAQVLRLSMAYALLSCSGTIKTQHLKAASALWDYCEQSAAFIFGGSVGSPIADKILRALQGNQKGLTRDEIRDLLQHNRNKEEIDDALTLLAKSGLARFHREPTGGRSAERWTAV